jgi:DNA-binding NarL/FixJ family response regulator
MSDSAADTLQALYTELEDTERTFQSTRKLLGSIYATRCVAVVALHESGESMSQIAEFLGVSKSMVQKMIEGRE